MPTRACAECGRPFNAPAHQPGQSAVTLCDRHTEKPKPRKKAEPDTTGE